MPNGKTTEEKNPMALTTRIQTAMNRHGEIEVHAAGCRDLNNGRKFQTVHPVETATCQADVAESTYGQAAGSFYQEGCYGGAGGFDKTYPEFLTQVIDHWLHWAPCVHLPEWTREAEAAAKATDDAINGRNGQNSRDPFSAHELRQMDDRLAEALDTAELVGDLRAVGLDVIDWTEVSA